jgi:shikimate kinase
MGCGKTTVGRILARKLEKQFVDIDRLIEEKVGKSVAMIFEELGEPAFRDMEALAVQELAVQSNLVIAAGGGMVTRPQNTECFLKSDSVMIYLHVDVGTAYERTKGNSRRPLLNTQNPLERIKALMTERAPYYEKIPFRVETSHRTPEEVVEEIIQRLNSLLTRSK